MPADYFTLQQQEEIDERIDILDFDQAQEQTLQSPSLNKYFYITQFLLSRMSPGSHGTLLEGDEMFKEQVIASQQTESI